MPIPKDQTDAPETKADDDENWPIFEADFERFVDMYENSAKARRRRQRDDENRPTLAETEF